MILLLVTVPSQGAEVALGAQGSATREAAVLHEVPLQKLLNLVECGLCISRATAVAAFRARVVLRTKRMPVPGAAVLVDHLVARVTRRYWRRMVAELARKGAKKNQYPHRQPPQRDADGTLPCDRCIKWLVFTACRTELLAGVESSTLSLETEMSTVAALTLVVRRMSTV